MDRIESREAASEKSSMDALAAMRSSLDGTWEETKVQGRRGERA